MALLAAPRPLNRFAPDYPPLALAMRQSGTVRLLVKVGPDGQVQAVRVSRSAGTVLDQAAVGAAYAWTYTPPLQAGQPVHVWVEEIVDFRLK